MLIRRLILAFALFAGITPAIAQVPPPVPALPDTERRTTYSISGNTCACAVNFALYGDSTDFNNWIEVFLNGVQVNYNDPNSGWLITSPSGSLATLSRPITNAILTFNAVQTGMVQIVGARRPRRTSQFTENQGVSARSLNQVFTDIIATQREIWDKTNDVSGRAVLAPPGETLALLPVLASRANMGACFDSLGNLTSCVAPATGSFAAGIGIAFTGTGPTTISANPTSTAPIIIDPTTKSISCPTCVVSASTLTSAATIAALKTVTAPSVQTAVYVEGYFAFSDGGEGWFEYCTACTGADNGGTLIIPNSAPANGRWVRSHVGTTGNDINVKWFGAKGDGSTSDLTPVANARDVAIATRGTLYFPASTGCYIVKLTIPDTTSGLRIHGDGIAYTAPQTCISSSDVTSTLDIQSVAGTSGNIVVENMRVLNTGAGDAIILKNLLWIKVSNVIAQVSGAGSGVHLSGVGNFSLNDVVAYASTSGPALKIEASSLTNSGPGVVSAGQYSLQGGNATSCIVVSGEPSGIVFNGIQVSCQGPNVVASVLLDGDGTSANQASDVTFIQPHSESSYNTANTSADFLIGNTNAFGAVSIIGGTAFGQGNGTNFQRDSVRVVAARSVSVRDLNMTSLGSGTGYTRAGIRLETTFTGQYSFTNNFVDSGKTLYSDANARLATTYFGNASYDVTAFNNLLGTITNNNACAGCIGETIEADIPTGSPVSLVNVTAKTITSINVTPGDWDIRAMVGFIPAGTTSVTLVLGSISLTNNTFDVTLGRFTQLSQAAAVPGNTISVTVMPLIFKFNVTTPVYCIGYAGFTVSTMTAFCHISARRMR